jgi:phage terminase large subunit-like protein
VGKNRSQYHIKTYAQGWEAFQGDEYDLIHLDEEPEWDIMQECIMRTVKRNGCILLTFTSLAGYTKVVNFLWESNNPLVSSHILDLYMNPYIKKESKDIIMSAIDPDEIESRIHGKPHLKEGLVYKSFGTIHKIDRFEYKKLVYQNPGMYQIHECIDPRERTPHHWLRFLYNLADDILYVVEEVKAPYESMLIEDFSRLIKAKRGLAPRSKKASIPLFTQIDTSSMKPIVVGTQGTEQANQSYTVRADFRKWGIDTILCMKDNALGIGIVKSMLKTVKTATGEIKRKPKLYVFRDLAGVCWEFTRYSWANYASSKTAESKELLNAPKKKDDHYMDCVKYECLKIRSMDLDQTLVVNQHEILYKDIGY